MRVRDLDDVDLYRALGVEPTAAADEIARAYRALAKQLHPDAAGAPVPVDAEARFARVAAAYEVLRDPERRRRYDLERRAGVVGAVPARPRPAAPPPGPAFRASAPRPAFVWSSGRARLVVVAGALCTLVGIAVCVGVVGSMVASAADRRDDVTVTATRVERAGAAFVRFRTVAGDVVEVPEPEAVNPGSRRRPLQLRYEADDPTDVQVAESTLARDLTILLVGVKLVVAGPVFWVLGRRRLRAAAAAPSPTGAR